MNRRTTQIATLIAVLGLAMVGQAAAQQMQRVSYKVTAENSKYTQQQLSMSETCPTIRCDPLKSTAHFRLIHPLSTA
jgi:hypothetical protein